MKSSQAFKKIFIHRDPVDMRKSINGLSEIVQLEQMGDLMEPHLFVFCSRRRDILKVLYFDKNGFALWQKKLEKERFKWPKKKHSEEIVHLSSEQFSWLLEGYDIWKMKPFAELQFERVC